MSTKGSRKNAAPKTNAIITRTKSAQQTRQLRAKTKKTEKPVNTKSTNSKSPVKSPKVTKSENCCKDTPSLKTKVRTLVKLVEQVEYYPDKLKRAVPIKKVLLKPKHNFKVIAAANKRKLGIPQKGGGITSPPPVKKRRRTSSRSTKSNASNRASEVSMADMVRLIEDNHSLSEEDFMEILTCPSPVWWEDPPDERYTEDSIFKRHPNQSSPISVSADENSRTGEQNDRRTNTPTNKSKSNKQTKHKETLIDFESEIEHFKITQSNTNSDTFNIKKQKLENILGNIKNSNMKPPQMAGKKEIKSNKIIKKPAIPIKSRRISNSTDGDMSDLSFNEEEVLKNLENMVIPVEQNKIQSVTNIIEIDIKDTETKTKTATKKKVTSTPITKEPVMPKITVKKFAQEHRFDSVVPDKMPPLTRKPDAKPEKAENSDYLNNVSHSKFRFISDDDISLSDSIGDERSDARDKKSLEGRSSPICIDFINIDESEKEQIEIKSANDTGSSDKRDFFRKKNISDISEYITVYKIMSNDNDRSLLKGDILNKSADKSSNNNVTGKLNSFFKKRKNNKRVKKSDSSFPAKTLTAVKDVPIDNVSSDVTVSAENDENRLNACDNCVVKTENGGFACESCNFLADTKEVYKNHVSSCKDAARISYRVPNHSYLMNQT